MHSVGKAWLNNGSGWTNASYWIPPSPFTTTGVPDYGDRFLDVNGDGLPDIVSDFANTSATSRTVWINTGSGWSNSSSWMSPEPFTANGKNIGRRIGDVNGGYSTSKSGINQHTVWLVFEHTKFHAMYCQM